MKATALIAAALMLAAAVQPVQGQTGKAPVPVKSSGACATLMLQFNKAEQSMASTDAEGVLDNSAPRATLRAVEISNFMATATAALQLMQARSCPLPDHAPTPNTYFMSALSCKTDQGAGKKDTPACDRKTWKAYVASE
jgi:hypothetical protein